MNAIVCLFLILAAHASNAVAATPAPYAGQESRQIKALSPDDVAALDAGKGMGLAKAAELNGYPGPLHVLELAPELNLSAKQRQQTEALYASMRAKAIDLGRALVAEERQLDQEFANRRVTHESMIAALAKIGELQARLRAAHLEAHLEQVRILTPEQNAQYGRLRGYGAAAVEQKKHGVHKH
jgi:Spy/CpxP family protein refolding chaperone